MRYAEVHRKTNETDILLKFNLDGKGAANIETGVGFLDHMLHHVAVHGLFDLEIKASGDLHVDAHHTIEDTALTFGKAIDQALGGREGIARMGSAYVPMDESLAFVAVDLSGRPYTVVQASWHAPTVGDFPTSLISHFFHSLAVTARCNLHAQVLYGGDDHHQAEALFKAFGRALHAASLIDARRRDLLPSTKGSLA